MARPRVLKAAALPFLASVLAGVDASASTSLANYTAYANTDITPCQSPCVRVGNCGYNYNVSCDPAVIAAACDATCGCVAWNSNGWLKGCGNVSCGAVFEQSAGTTTYVLTKSGGVPPATPDAVVDDIDDVHYPPEEPQQAADAAPAVLALPAAGSGECWAVLQQPGGGGSSQNTSCGSSAFGFLLQAVVSSLPPSAGGGGGGGEGAAAVLERTFARWGYIAYVAPASAGGGELARMRKGTGSVTSLVMPTWSYIPDRDCLYWTKVSDNATDYLRARILADTGGQPSFLAAAKYMPPQRDYAHIGAVEPYQKYSVSPDGRIKLADGAIWTTANVANETGPGTLIWDPRTHLPDGCWPATNYTYSKSALAGRHLRVVAVISYSPDTGSGFEQVAFSPASDPSGNVLVRLQAVMGNATSGPAQYWNVSAGGTATPMPDPSGSPFYYHLYSEQALWNGTLSNAGGTGPASVISLPGQEGARQVDMTWGGILSSMSLFVGLTPNYGDGEDYWSPGGDNGGNLPFQTWNLNIALQDAGLINASAVLLEYYFNNYIVNGTYSTGTWELSCPDGFADGRSDHGILMSLLVRSVRRVLATNGLPPPQAGAWAQARMATLASMANYSLTARANATANGPGKGDVRYGLIWGSPEHDTCRDTGYYYHNQVWFIRGMLEAGRLISDICGYYCPDLVPLGPALLAEAAAFQADLNVSLAQSVVRNATTGAVIFVPPVAVTGMAPFGTMIESTLAEYSNFRYYNELLGADILAPEYAVGLMDFRESHTGSVSGITRWDDHLDDMPSLHYLSSSLWYNRLPSFWSLQYGHMANYHGRGTWTATEQIPIGPDANGFYRDYLWSYLEGGIDECVPSIVLPALGTQMALVQERFDANTLWLGKGAPSRWVQQPAAATGTAGASAATYGPGYGVTNFNTRFGLVSFHGNTTAGQAPATELASAAVTYVQTGSPGVSQNPTFIVRLVPADPSLALQTGSVTVSGQGAVVGVDGEGGMVSVVLSGPLTTTWAFTVQGTFA